MAEFSASRRSVLGAAGVTVASGVAGYLVASTSDAAGDKAATAAANGSGPAPGYGNRVLATLDEIPEGGAIILADEGVVLSRGAGEDVQAFSATCTHQGCTVNAIEDGLIVCPCHLSRFDLRTGEPVSGPANRALPGVAVTVRGNDVVSG